MHTRFHPSPLPIVIRVLSGVIILSIIFYLLSPVFGDFSVTIVLFFSAIGLITILGAWTDCRFKTLELDDANITFTVGILSTKTAVVPFARLTNVIVTRSFLERILGLGSIIIDTPGGSNIPEIDARQIPYVAIEIIVDKTEGKKIHP